MTGLRDDPERRLRDVLENLHRMLEGNDVVVAADNQRGAMYGPQVGERNVRLIPVQQK